ncbi:MAG: ATP-binding protein [Archangium sp.]|nr:ATP-binding protein [Archangium sp.]
MELDFVNRTEELAQLDEHARAGGLLVVFGRRRVGKTRLLTQWLKRREGLYSQAIEASKEQQLQQVFDDLRPQLASSIVPRSFGELLELLDLQAKDFVFCLDELPYLVAADPSLPSVLQRWIDHRKRKKSSLILAGSSTRMMNDLFLNRGAPLFGRARKILEVAPMSYRAFCKACGQNPASKEAFVRFSLVGGVPKYWELVRRGQSSIALAEELFFGSSPALEFEPSRLLKDEGVLGLTAPAVLEAVGRGSHKPSEIAARLGTPQTNLSRLFQVLLDSKLLERELPFGESVRTTKRTLYKLADPTMRFWFRVYSPHRSRWRTYSAAEKQKLLEDHASTVFEDQLRARWPGSSRYWEADVELDFVREDEAGLVVSEVKWATLGKGEAKAMTGELEKRFRRTALGQTHAHARFEVLDAGALRLIGEGPRPRSG